MNQSRMNVLDLDLKVDERAVQEATKAWNVHARKGGEHSGPTALVNMTAILGCTATPSEMLWSCSGSLAPRSPCSSQE